jgi:hypothetical protein
VEELLDLLPHFVAHLRQESMSFVRAHPPYDVRPFVGGEVFQDRRSEVWRELLED